MPGIIAIGADGADFSRLNLKFEAIGPLVTDQKDLGSVYFARYTNPKFLRDKVFEDDADVAVAMDGMVFNFRRLQEEYGAADYFQTVKAMYQRLGDQFFKAFRGEAAGVLYDKARRRWVAFTNHTASKPLFHYHAPGLFVCSTDFDVLAQALRGLGRKYTLDPFGAYCLLTYGYMLEDATLLEEVKKLKGGCCLTFENDRLAVDAYVRFRNEPYLTAPKQEIIETVDTLFDEAVRLQYEKDVEYGYDHLATLSGGLDSRTGFIAAYELGYRRQLAFTFSQTNYLDEQIAKRIASDFGTEFVFYSLDNGHYLEPMFRHAVRANGGLILFAGSAHLLAALCRVDTARTGMLHMGQVGDAVLGSFLRGVATRKAEIPWGAYSPFLIDRIAPQVQAIIDRYETEDEFLMYNRGFNGALNGNWTTYQLTECTSPFLDMDLLEYAMHIPRALRYREQIYLDWVLAKHPLAARYIWEKTKARLSDPDLVRRAKKLWWMASIVLARRWDQVSMNPWRDWYRRNAALREFVEGYWRRNADRLDKWPDLKADAGRLFREGPRGLIAKAQVMTLLEAMKRHFG